MTTPPVFKPLWALDAALSSCLVSLALTRPISSDSLRISLLSLDILPPFFIMGWPMGGSGIIAGAVASAIRAASPTGAAGPAPVGIPRMARRRAIRDGRFGRLTGIIPPRAGIIPSRADIGRESCADMESIAGPPCCIFFSTFPPFLSFSSTEGSVVIILTMGLNPGMEASYLARVDCNTTRRC